MPRLGSMYQKVSITSWCSPVDWPPALIAQMLNQPAFLIVPSGFSTIRVWLRGRFEIDDWACAGWVASQATAASRQHRSMRIGFLPRCRLGAGLAGTLASPRVGVNVGPCTVDRATCRRAPTLSRNPTFQEPHAMKRLLTTVAFSSLVLVGASPPGWTADLSYPSDPAVPSWRSPDSWTRDHSANDL